MFLKLKQEASGFPEGVVTDEEKDKYIEEYFAHEGIILNKENIKKNSGLRQSAKLQLNSLYGKFGQRLNMQKSKFITKPADLYKILTDPSKKMSNYHVMSDNMLQVEFENESIFMQMDQKSNVVIAAFCTCWARLKLWGVMNELGSRVLYHDTDSILYSYREGETCLPLGNYLGDLCNELSCDKIGCKNNCVNGEHFIVEYVSCGPKNYAYILDNGAVTCKVRGFSLNYNGSRIINFQSMKNALFMWYEGKMNDCIDEKSDNVNENTLISVATSILRNKHTISVYNRKVPKHYGIVYDKRALRSDYETVPFGY